MDSYYGAYERFDTTSKKDAAPLLGADNLIGDRYQITVEFSEGHQVAWLENRFQRRVGYFNASISRNISILKAKGLTVTALLSYVAFTEDSDSGHYWGEMALIAFPQSEHQAFDTFLSTISQRLAEGIRPDINLSEDGYTKVIASNGSWTPEKSLPKQNKPQGTVILKSHRSLSDRMIEQGRKGNKGCYVLSWLFLLALVIIVFMGLRSCGVW